MTTHFTASNGIEIEISEHGYLLGKGDYGSGPTYATAGPEGIDALREYFTAERDEQLGRWRDPEDDNMVVYRVPEGDDKDGRAVRVIDEATGTYASLWERDTRRFGCGSMHATAAIEAALPHIEAALRKQIAADLRAKGNTYPTHSERRGAWHSAARIAQEGATK